MYIYFIVRFPEQKLCKRSLFTSFVIRHPSVCFLFSAQLAHQGMETYDIALPLQMKVVLRLTTLYITTGAWKQIEEAIRKQPEVETGGILMGYALNAQDWVITYASEPGPNAIHQQRSIFFDDAYLRKLARRLRTRYSYRWQYLGDWHSHTVRRLTPSRGDKVTLREKTAQAVYQTASPIMLIAGLNRRGHVQARAYMLSDGLREIRPLLVIGRQELQQLRQTPQ